MELRTFACPNCGAGHQFYLSSGDRRHLRRCPTCDRWFVAAERSDGSKGRMASRGPRESGEDGTRHDVVGLDDPPACPVEGCTETPPADDLPAHVIAAHDGSLSPPSGDEAIGGSSGRASE